MENFKIIGKIGEGAHGTVWKARNKNTEDIYALKKILMKKISDGIPITALREVKTLQQIEHENVVRLFDTFTDGPGFVLVFEYMVSDLSSVLLHADRPLDESVVKSYMLMLLKGLAYCHGLQVMHRDLKPANLLIGKEGLLKIADFGLARIYWEDKTRLYSHQVVTRWYRAPELLYGAKQYNEGVDLWAVGCIFGEMLNNSPLFPGENDIEQLCLVLKTLGTPTNETWPGLRELPDYSKITFPESQAIPFEEILPEASSQALQLVKMFLLYDSSQRISADKAINDKYFLTRPLPCQQRFLPIPPGDHKFRDQLFDEADCFKPIEDSMVNPKDIDSFTHLWKS